MKDEPPKKEFHLGQTKWLVNSFFLFFFRQSDKSRKNAKFKKGFGSETDGEPEDGI